MAGILIANHDEDQKKQGCNFNASSGNAFQHGYQQQLKQKTQRFLTEPIPSF